MARLKVLRIGRNSRDITNNYYNLHTSAWFTYRFEVLVVMSSCFTNAYRSQSTRFSDSDSGHWAPAA